MTAPKYTHEEIRELLQDLPVAHKIDCNLRDPYADYKPNFTGYECTCGAISSADVVEQLLAELETVTAQREAWRAAAEAMDAASDYYPEFADDFERSQQENLQATVLKLFKDARVLDLEPTEAT